MIHWINFFQHVPRFFTTVIWNDGYSKANATFHRTPLKVARVREFNRYAMSKGPDT